MGNFKDSDYYKSDKHIQSILNAGVLGIKKIQEQRDRRIEEYNKNPKRCLFCNSPIEYQKKNEKKFCNSSCAASYNNKKRILKEETKNKIRKSVNLYYKNNPDVRINNKKYTLDENFNKIIKCEYCNKNIIVKRLESGKLSKAKFCSVECRERSRSKKLSESAKERVKNGTHNGWSSRNVISYPERFFKKVLHNNNLTNYEFNKPITKKELGINENGNYFLDFFFKNLNLDLEIDGKQHEERKEHDIKRDNALKNNDIIVYRIKWKSINTKNGKKYIKNEIDNFLIFYKKLIQQKTLI